MIGGNGLRRTLNAQQAQQDRDEGQRDHGGNQPDIAPAKQRHDGNDDDPFCLEGLTGVVGDFFFSWVEEELSLALVFFGVVERLMPLRCCSE